MTLIFFLAAGVFFAVPENFAAAGGQTRNARYMTEGEYQAALAAQSRIHGFIREASFYEKKGQHDLALANYLKAYEIDHCAGLVAVCRGAMADNYEALGEYEKALEHVDWFLEGLKPDEPLFKNMTETKQRLLQKIAANCPNRTASRGEG